MEATILLVEDDLGIRSVLADLFEIEGIPAHICENAMEALAYAHEHVPSLVVLDMGLPGMSGMALARALRIQWTERVPILAITADGHAAEKAAEAVADELLPKPFSVPALLSCIYTLRSQ